MQREFTGRDMAKVLIGGFGIVVAVNMTMATFASQSFSGVVVENSYVASQKYNGWLEEARKSDALAWDVNIARNADGYIMVSSPQIAAEAQVSAQLRRPLGEREFVSLTFAPVGAGQFRSVTPVPTGRWTGRFRIESAEGVWTEEISFQ